MYVGFTCHIYDIISENSIYDFLSVSCKSYSVLHFIAAIALVSMVTHA